MTPAWAFCEGATGATVRWARYLLAGLTLSCDRIDGIVGPVTSTAGGHFQRDSYRTVDGVPGRRMSRAPGRLMPADPVRGRGAAAPPPCCSRPPGHQEEPR